MTEAVPEDAFLACAQAGLCHVKGMIAFLRGTVAESYPQRLILDVHGVGYEVIVPLSTFDRLNPLPGRELTLKPTCMSGRTCRCCMVLPRMRKGIFSCC